jgi:hypothetical protein
VALRAKGVYGIKIVQALGVKVHILHLYSDGGNIFLYCIEDIKKGPS